ncbi:hypothetical protein ICC18_01105 [Paenibacillus sp. WST5]|uniref:DUF4352 domain-containing protein n=2 Tax=Paenibacillus sedimenti TaxID=2770274 RepID=A0A926KM86_9BACL|nr:hypothetical protein [Paenibacillus sedimenti]
MKLAALAFSISLTLSTVTPAIADGEGSAIIGKVSISEQSYFELKQIHLTASQNSKLAVINVSLHNGGSSALKAIDYWIRLKNKAGSQFSARPLPSDKDKTSVAPGSSVDLTFYANVNENTQLQDLVVQFMNWDLNRPKFERMLGEVYVPAAYTDVTPPQEGSIFRVGETEVKASIKKLVSNKNEKYHVPAVYLTLENIGGNAVAIPAYMFSIRTPEGLLYPLEAKGIKDLAIKPKESKEIQLAGTIPVAVSSDQWELIITETAADLKINLPVAAFQLPAATLSPDGSIGKAYSFTSKSGVYSAEMNALYRLPWEDQDLLSADLALSNKGPDTLALPKLTGYFLLDDAVKIEASVVQTANVVGIASGSSLNLQMVGKIPYTSKYSRIKLVLQEKESDTVTTDVVEFSSQSEVQAIPFHSLDQTYTLADEGRKTGFKIRSLNRYASNTSSLVIAQVEATNLEKRYTVIPKPVAHFRSADGTVLPALVAEVTNKVSPNGAALLNVSAMLPKGFSTENMHLIIGESVTEGKLTESGGTPDSYVKPVAFMLPEVKTDVKNSLMNVDVYPYQISLYQIATMIENSTFTMKFNYEISREGYLETNVDGHKLVLVFEDGGGQKSFEKWFEMKDFDPVDGETPETGGTKLKLGKHENFKIQVTDADLLFKSSFLKQYKLSLYDEFQGQRKLLATQKADWFVTTD